MRVHLSIIIIFALSVSACVDDGPQAPAGRFSSYVQAMAAGGASATFDLLEPDVREDVVKLYETLRASAELVRSGYPEPAREASLRALGATAAEKAADPATYFAALVDAEGGAALDRLATWGARPLSAEADNGKARVRTIAGDSFDLIRASDGSWCLAVSPELAVALRSARSKAEANLEIVEAEVARLSALRDGRVFGAK